jgi:hypothetical protein
LIQVELENPVVASHLKFLLLRFSSNVQL